MSETIGEEPIDGRISQGAVVPDLDPSLLAPGAGETSATVDADADAALESAMASGQDGGSPGERAPVDPDDHEAIAVQDDAPLPVGDPGSGGGSQGDGMDAEFVEPPD